MLEMRDAMVVEVNHLDVHGVAYVDLRIALEDREVAVARLGVESVPADLRAGDRVQVDLVMNMIVAVRRPPDGDDPVG
jgi:hypothetical protein